MTNPNKKTMNQYKEKKFYRYSIGNNKTLFSKRIVILKSSQISFEFIIIFSLVIMAMTGFIYFINLKINEISREQDKALAMQLSEDIANEVMMASSVSDNYIRKFDIPYKLNGKTYYLGLSGDELEISIYSNGGKKSSYYSSLPMSVKGSFMKNISFNTTGHCITKSKKDGIRISKNQASLDTAIYQVKHGDVFDVYLSIYCIVNVKSIKATIQYDPGVLKIEAAEPIVSANPIYNNLTPLFNDYNLIYNYNNSEYIDASKGRFTFGYLGSECVSGNGEAIKLTFKVLDTAPKGETYIRFDDRLNDSIRLLDCKTNKFTKKGMPDSTKSARIIVTDEPPPPVPEGNSLFNVYNSHGEKVASFMDSGDIALMGECYAGSCNNRAHNIREKPFIIEDSSSNIVAYIDGYGNICITDNDCNYYDLECSDFPDGSFIIENNTGAVVSYISSIGRLCTVGEIYEKYLR